jgi:transcriptional regulator with XRE-family HTH domain
MKPSTVRRIRTSLGLTQDEAGLLFGGGPRAFTKYEGGEIVPSAALQRLLYCADKMPAILGVLGVAVATKKFDSADDGTAESDWPKVPDAITAHVTTVTAAAPELYEALERILGPAGYRDDNSITRQARAALAKARGEDVPAT